MAEFKKLSDVEAVAEPTESANVLIEENGVIKKAPKTAVGGGTGGGVSSWNDLTDKPFSISIEKIATTGEVNVSFDNFGSCTIPAGEMLDYLYGDQALNVKYNGVEYICTGETVSVRTIFGDTSFINYPFYFMIDPYTMVDIAFTANDTSDSTIEIYLAKEVINPIEERFIPDSIARINDISWNDLTDKPFYEEYLILHQGTYTLTCQENPVNYELEYGCTIGSINLDYNKEYIVTINGVSQKSVYMQGTLAFKGGSYSPGSLRVRPSEEQIELGYPDITIDFMVQDPENVTTVPLDVKYLPKAVAVANAAGETPTATEFNALLTALRNAGYLAT
jgi:hypothetical protein